MGIFDKLKGKAKEALGTARGSDSLRHEGQQQQLKADEETKAQQAELEAERHRKKAKDHQRKEEGFQQGT